VQRQSLTRGAVKAATFFTGKVAAREIADIRGLSAVVSKDLTTTTRRIIANTNRAKWELGHQPL
jgi:hypothetical protein